MTEQNWVAVAAPSLVFVGLNRRDFDALAADATDHGDQGAKGHVMTKDVRQGALTVVFQHWVKTPALPDRLASNLAVATP